MESREAFIGGYNSKSTVDDPPDEPGRPAIQFLLALVKSLCIGRMQSPKKVVETRGVVFLIFNVLRSGSAASRIQRAA